MGLQKGLGTMNTREWEVYKAQRRREDPRWTDEELPAKLVPHFRSGVRIRVANGEYVRTGKVGITTGWRPAFLLMHRSSDTGSSDVLNERDQITGVQSGRAYISPDTATAP